jgi:hypothetical protein
MEVKSKITEMVNLFGILTAIIDVLVNTTVKQLVSEVTRTTKLEGGVIGVYTMTVYEATVG